MNNRRHHAENPELHSFGKWDGFIFPVGGLEIPAFPVRTEKFHREFIVDTANHDGTVTHFEAAVDDKDIARADSRSRHGVARGTNKKGRGRPVNQQFVQIQRRLDILLRRCLKSSCDWQSYQRRVAAFIILFSKYSMIPSGSADLAIRKVFMLQNE